MKIKQNVCSKLWSDSNIDFRRQEFRHCCKAVGFPITFEEMDQLGVDVFERNERTLNDKHQMLFENKIPEVSCRLCALNGDNAIRHSWNGWDDHFINANRDHLMDRDETHYIEIDIGDQCDLACVYCGPWSSTTWKKEQGMTVKPKTDYQQQWTDRMMDLLVQRIDQMDKSRRISINFLGGEPTLMPEVYTLIDNLTPIFKKFEHKINLMFTTNLNTKGPLFERMLETIQKTNEFAHWTCGVSIENVGERAELVRYGLDWNRFHSNMMELQHYARIALTCTHNYFSLPHWSDTLEYFFDSFETEFGGPKPGEGWLITSNCVYDNVLDPAYLQQEFVDWNNIYQTLERLIPDKNSKHGQQLIQHTNDMRTRVGTRTPDKHFYHYHKNISMRTPGYFQLFPYYEQVMTELEQKYSQEFAEDYFAVRWRNAVNPAHD